MYCIVQLAGRRWQAHAEDHKRISANYVSRAQLCSKVPNKVIVNSNDKTAHLAATKSTHWNTHEIEMWVKATVRAANQACMQQLAINRDKERCLQVRSQLILQRWHAAKPSIPLALHDELLQILLHCSCVWTHWV